MVASSGDLATAVYGDWAFPRRPVLYQLDYGDLLLLGTSRPFEKQEK